MDLSKPRRYIRERPGTVCAVAFLLVAAIVVFSDILDLPALVSSALPASARWLHPAIEVFLILLVGALATYFISLLVLEQKQSRQELALRASILDAADDSIFAYHPDGTMVYANEAGYKSRGYTEQELMKMNRRDLATPEHCRLFDQWTRSLAENGEMLAEFEHVSRDGSPIPVEERVRRVKIGDQELIVSICRDITRRKRLQETLRESERRLKDAQIAGSIGDWAYDLATQKVTWSDQTYDLYGRDKALGPPSADEEASYYTPAQASLLREFFQQAVSTGQPLRYDLEAQLPSGKAVSLGATMRVIKDTHGQVARVFGTVQDITERKRVEEELRKERENFQNSMEMSPLGIQIVTPKGDLIYANKTMLDTWGYSNLAELKAVPMELRFTPESVAVIRENVIRHKWGNVIVPYELTAIRKSGELRYLSAHPKEVVWDGQAQVQTLYQDITKRKQAEEALMFKTALLEAQTEATAEGILVSDDEGRLIHSNRRFRDMWRIPEGLMESEDGDPVLSHTALMVIDPESFVQRVRYLRSHREESGEDTIDMRDGRVIVRQTGPLVDRDGTYRGRVWYFRDITEPRKIRERLEHAAEEWRRTFDSIPDAVSIQDKDSRLVSVNKAYADLFKQEPQQLLGRTCYGLVHGTECPRQDCPHQVTLKTGQAASEEFFEPHLEVYLEVKTTPLRDDKGDVVGTVHIARDVTKRREMEKQLMLADRMVSIGELASGVAHELNNPLTTVIGFSELLMERKVPDEIKKDLDLIHAESQRAAGIVKNLLTFARGHELFKRLTRIDDIIESVLRLRAYEQAANNIRVVTRIDPGLPKIMADSAQMQQVFLNLVINAEFFMTKAHNRGTLTIDARECGGMVRISVADDGPGILPENLGHLFNPFFTTKEVGKGTGLGLSICHGIVTAHGGRIYAESPPGEGATFCVELPAVSQTLAGDRAVAGLPDAAFGQRTEGRIRPLPG